MKKDIQLTLSPEQAFTETLFIKSIARKTNCNLNDIKHYQIIQRSLDARKRDVKVHLKVDVYINEDAPERLIEIPDYKNVINAEEIIIIGAGPAGLFAALELVERGKKPIIIERGKKVEERKIDIAQLNRNVKLDEDSNYCFGEGGAGTFSDGKLYTRSKKKGDTKKILGLLYHFGASEEILYDSHPHIGSDKLPTIIKNIRNFIIEKGGEFYFDTKLEDIVIQSGRIKKINCSTNEFEVNKLILATGHSARDIYYILNKHNIELESKPFALGVRVEHPQYLIDSIQYHRNGRGDYLPASSYKLIEHIDERAVFSFCMCPGGFIVPSASSNGETVVNGMSPAKRNSPFANSGMVVQVKVEDYQSYDKYGGLAGIKFQEEIEKNASKFIENPFQAPAQRLVDFCEGKISDSLPEHSYIPGLQSQNLNKLLPDFTYHALKNAFPLFNKKMYGYYTNEAIVVGVESRTSSPVRIPRNAETFQQLQISNLYPCGEGAGYAGGITSSAIDGINVARAV
jgi:uncharacterized protein